MFVLLYSNLNFVLFADLFSFSLYNRNFDNYFS